VAARSRDPCAKKNLALTYKCPSPTAVVGTARRAPRASTAPSKRHPFATHAIMSEVTEQQIREFYQQKALIEALERTQAGLKQQLAAETDLAQVMAALSFSADGPLRQGDIPCPSSNKRRGRSTSDENEGSPLPTRHRNARQGASSYSKRPTPLPQPAQQERVPRCGGEGGGLGARNFMQVLQVMQVSLVNVL